MRKLLWLLLVVSLIGLLAGCGDPYDDTRTVTGKIIAISPKHDILMGDSTHIFLEDGTHIFASYYIDLPIGQTYTFVLRDKPTFGNYNLIRVSVPPPAK